MMDGDGLPRLSARKDIAPTSSTMHPHSAGGARCRATRSTPTTVSPQRCNGRSSSMTADYYNGNAQFTKQQSLAASSSGTTRPSSSAARVSPRRAASSTSAGRTKPSASPNTMRPPTSNGATLKFLEWQDDAEAPPRDSARDRACPATPKLPLSNNNAPSPASELTQVRSENEQLRQEVGRLQEKLVTKMRGTTKLIGGGQFRMTGASSSPNASPSPNTPCANCVALRTALKKCRQEPAENEHSMVTALKQQIEQGKVAQEKLQMTNDIHEQERRRLEPELASLLEARERDQEDIRRLQEALIMAQELSSVHMSSDSDSNNNSNDNDRETPCETIAVSTQCSPEKPQSVAISACETIAPETVTLAAFQELQDENLRLQRDVELWERKAVEHDQVWRATREENKVAHEHWQRQHANSEQRVHERDARIAQLLKDIATMHKTVATLKEIGAVQQEELVMLEEVNRRQSHEILEKEAACDAARQQNEHMAAILSHLQTRVRQLEAQTQAQAKRATTTSTLAPEIQKHQADALAQALAQTTQLTDDKQALEARLQAAQHELDTCARRCADLLEMLELLMASKQQDATVTQVLTARLAAAEAEVADSNALVQQLQEQQRLHAQDMATAMQSFVRLCIVAPTVNVHVGNNAVVSCRAALVPAELERVVTRDVLPRFTSAFVQQGEQTGPGGVSMDDWLPTLLADMQASIQQHLAAQQTAGASSGSSNSN